MEILSVLKRALQEAADVIRWGAGLQGDTRKALVDDLQTICGNLDSAYEAVLARLAPVKNAYMNPPVLATELRNFAADAVTRRQFKPEYLCGQVDHLLERLNNNLDPLKYSVDFGRIRGLRRSLMQFGNVDGALFESYDTLTAQLDQIATQMQDKAFDPLERAGYARRVIEGFEAELRSTLRDIRSAKAQVVGSI